MVLIYLLFGNQREKCINKYDYYLDVTLIDRTIHLLFIKFDFIGYNGRANIYRR